MTRIYSLFFFLLMYGSGINAQNKSGCVSVSLQNQTLGKLLTQLEQQTGVRILGEDSKLDSLKISIAVVNQPIEIVFEAIHQQSGLLATYLPDGTIILQSYRIPIESRQIRSTDTGHIPASTVRDAIDQQADTLPQNTIKVYTIGAGNASNKSAKGTFSGYIKHHQTGEGISGAWLVIEGLGIRTVADINGYFSVTLPKGRHRVQLSAMGLSTKSLDVIINGSGSLDLQMQEAIVSLKTVTVAANKTRALKDLNVGLQTLSIAHMKRLPTLLGETDVMRVLQTLPGVSSVGEASSGLNVRGGAVDQNLVLLDGCTIYNPSHFFGFFSGFNPDVVKQAELYKGFIPAALGGRVSSVLEVVTREGHRKKFSGSGGIGPVSGHLSLEGPVNKQISILAGVRSTYSNWLLKLLDDKRYKNSSAGFMDAVVKIAYDWNTNNSFSLVGYWSRDKFALLADTTYLYGNTNFNVKWKHIFNGKLHGTFTLGFDKYQFEINSQANQFNAFRYQSANQQYHIKSDFSYVPNPQHRWEYGTSLIKYQFVPGGLEPLGRAETKRDILKSEKGLEYAAYVSDQFSLTPQLAITGGVRWSGFIRMGPGDQLVYGQGLPREEQTAIDTLHFLPNKMMKSYGGLEPRLAIRYLFNERTSVKASYNLTRQYLHQVSNTHAVSPTDRWKLSDAYLPPQIGHQISLGYYDNLNKWVEVSVEAYYKWLYNALCYKNGASLLLSHHLETEVGQGKGKAYGVEVLLRKVSGRLTGWLSYTYSRSWIKMDDPLVTSKVNQGRYYAADFDKPHNASLVSNYRVSHRFSVSLTSNYSTGRPITLPVGRYFLDGSYRMLYGERNGYRIPDYFRLDFSVNIEGNHKIKKLGHSSWTVGVYNLTARKNAYSVFFVSEDGKTNGYKLSVFGTAIPFITYNFKF